MVCPSPNVGGRPLKVALCEPVRAARREAQSTMILRPELLSACGPYPLDPQAS